MSTAQKSRLLAAVTVCAGLVLGACTIDTSDRDEAAPSTFTETPSQAPSSTPPQAPVDVQEFLVPGGAIALNTGDGMAEAGQVTMPAWSTIKVPLAIAALRNDSATPEQITAAISHSSNEDAQALWDSLGSPEDAGQKTEQVLAEGDSATSVNTQLIRPEFSIFGQTEWPLADQAQFASHLQCLPGAQPVVDAMGAVAADQSYGLGTIPGALFKGGWGPDESGRYQVRQFGLVPVEGGFVSVAVAASPADGTYETGQAMLDDMAQNMQPALSSVKPVSC